MRPVASSCAKLRRSGRAEGKANWVKRVADSEGAKLGRAELTVWTEAGPGTCGSRSLLGCSADVPERSAVVKGSDLVVV